MTQPKHTDSSPAQSQVDKFREAARKPETDQSEEAFDHVLKKVIKDAHPREEGSVPASSKKSSSATTKRR